MRRLLIAVLLAALFGHHSTVRAQVAPQYVFCVSATSTLCSTTSNPGNGTQGDVAWLAFGKLNLDILTLQPPSPQYSLVFANGNSYGGVLPASTGIWCPQWTSLSGPPTLVGCPGSGSGSMTSYNVMVPSYLTATSCSTTTTTTCVITGTSLSANLFLASPNGSPGALTPRTITLGDIPLIPLASGVTGLLPLANGGIGVGTLTGIAKGNGTSAFTAAASTDVETLFACGGNAALYLNGAGGCTSPSGSGTVTTTGSPASGNLAKFSGASSIVNGDLSGDCATSGTLVVTCTDIGGKTVSLAGALSTAGAFGITFTVTGTTNVTLPTSGTLITNAVTSLTSLATVGTIATGVWQGTAVGAAYGGTGVANPSGASLALSAHALTLTTTATTNATIPAGTVSLGYLGVPLTGGATKTTNYTMVLADSGTEASFNCSSACTVTIPSNASVAYPVGTVLTFSSLCTATTSLTVAITSDTLYWGVGTPLTGSRTVAICGVGVARKQTTTTWAFTGQGITKLIESLPPAWNDSRYEIRGVA